MYLDGLKFSEEEAKEYSRKTSEVNYNTKLKFLKTHNGLRDFKMHLLISPTHAGKSTAIRSILFDILSNNRNKKVLIWLTEETIDEFKSEFCNAFPSHSILDNVALISEQNGEPTSAEIKKNVIDAIAMTKCDLIIVDNITTSKTYNSGGFSSQQDTAEWLKRISKKHTIFLVAHTNTGDFNNRFLTEQDIRGGKDIVNLSEFLYILQPITVGEKLFQFINIKKHRGQDTDGKMFRLYYNHILRIFDRDSLVTFSDIKEVFKQRNKLADR